MSSIAVGKGVARELLSRRLFESNAMFVIRLANGEEVQGGESDELEINQETGVLTVSRVDGFEKITTHYSPMAWLSVTHRQKGVGVRPSVISSAR